jgi:ribose transport system permease protein
MVLQNFIQKKRSEFISLCLVVGLIIFMTSFNPNFIGVANLNGLFMDMANLMVVGAGLMFVLLLGSIDLSAGAMASFAAVITATFVQTMGVGGIILALAFGVVAGIINGLLNVYLRIPSFIATLATMSVWSSMALVMSGSASVYVQKEAATVFDGLRWSAGPLSTPLFIGIAVIIITFVITGQTKIGKYMYAIGANETAARMSGAPVKMTKIMSFMLCGLFSALLGILLVAKIKSASPYVGDEFDMLGIAAAVLGGVSLSGGRGQAIWMITGCAVIAIVQNGITVIGVPAYAQNVVYGVIIMVAIIITADRKSRLQIVK